MPTLEEALLMAAGLMACVCLLAGGLLIVISRLFKIYGRDIAPGDNITKAAKIEDCWVVMEQPQYVYPPNGENSER